MGNHIQKNTLFNVFGNCVGNSIPLTLPMNFTKVFKPKINVEILIEVIFVVVIMEKYLRDTNRGTKAPVNCLARVVTYYLNILFTLSALWFFKAAEAGNLEEFSRLFHGDNTRLTVQDTKGRTAASTAASKDRINILKFIFEQHGDLNVLDSSGNTPLHVAVENNAFESIDYLLSM